MELPHNMDSKFRFILVAARRARQLQAGARPLIQTHAKRVTRVAQQEVAAGLVQIEMLAPPSNNNEQGKKTKTNK
jgi:DNA-directed RNA polymerase subunit omega